MENKCPNFNKEAFDIQGENAVIIKLRRTFFAKQIGKCQR